MVFTKLLLENAIAIRLCNYKAALEIKAEHLAALTK